MLSAIMFGISVHAVLDALGKARGNSARLLAIVSVLFLALVIAAAVSDGEAAPAAVALLVLGPVAGLNIAAPVLYGRASPEDEDKAQVSCLFAVSLCKGDGRGEVELLGVERMARAEVVANVADVLLNERSCGLQIAHLAVGLGDHSADRVTRDPLCVRNSAQHRCEVLERFCKVGVSPRNEPGSGIGPVGGRMSRTGEVRSPQHAAQRRCRHRG